MPLSLRRLQSLRLAGLSVALAWTLGCGLLWIPAWQAVELKAFDFLSIATAPRKSVLPITIVGIDEASFAQLGQRWPWPRDMHARLTDRLVQGGAAVIAFDLLLPEAGTRKEDAAFARSIQAAGSVVLAADHAYHETATSRQWLRIDPVSRFTDAGAVTGLATMTLDGDTVARRVAQSDDAFWRQAIRTLMRTRPGSVSEPYLHEGAMMRHLGPSHTFPYVSYYQVLNGDPSVPPDFFVDQIVLVGRDVRASPESGAAQADTFATPFLMTTGLLTPGVEIHATQIENALMGHTLRPASAAINVLAVSVVLLIAVPWLVFWHPLRSTLAGVFLGAAALGTSTWMFAHLNLWLATAAPLLALTLAFVASGLGSYLAERRRAGEIRVAFAKYVSSEVVAEMIAHPDRLKLGGQRREISVLFSDLAGFTSLSERLSPDAVANLINLYLSAMTRVIMARGGTVDKFIGDAVMAFWGAPLADEEHALHASQAAIDMQQAMRELAPQFAALGVANLGLRIGVSSGPAIVGNMGSDMRFDYTAIGDTVNLAARLEGANKAYGTGILLAAGTVEGIGGRLALRPVDRIRVKGKDLPVDVYTPCDDPALVEATGRAWRAYLSRDWAGACRDWQALLAVWPGDAPAGTLAARSAAFAATPPDADWDGSVALDKL